jgi:hypothetical protein
VVQMKEVVNECGVGRQPVTRDCERAKESSVRASSSEARGHCAAPSWPGAKASCM